MLVNSSTAVRIAFTFVWAVRNSRGIVQGSRSLISHSRDVANAHVGYGRCPSTLHLKYRTDLGVERTPFPLWQASNKSLSPFLSHIWAITPRIGDLLARYDGVISR